MKVLLHLASRPGEVLSKEQIIRGKLDRHVCVGDDALFHAISELRRVFETIPSSQFIETIAKKGYRLIASVQKAQRERLDEIADARFETSSALGRSRGVRAGSRNSTIIVLVESIAGCSGGCRFGCIISCFVEPITIEFSSVTRNLAVRCSPSSRAEADRKSQGIKSMVRSLSPT